MTPEQNAEFIYNNASLYAQAKAARVKVELELKATKAFLMTEALKNGFKQAVAQEREALSSDDYGKLIYALAKAVEVEETLKLQLQSADLSIQIWRTREASERLAIRSHE
jgi:hypothetical protein